MGTSLSQTLPRSWRNFHAALERTRPQPEEVLEALQTDLGANGRDIALSATAQALCRELLNQIAALRGLADAGPVPITTEVLERGGGLSMAELLGHLGRTYRERFSGEPLPMEWGMNAFVQVLYRHSCPTLQDYFQRDITEVRPHLENAVRTVGTTGFVHDFLVQFHREAARHFVARQDRLSLPPERAAVEQDLDRSMVRHLDRTLPHMRRADKTFTPGEISEAFEAAWKALRPDDPA